MIFFIENNNTKHNFLSFLLTGFVKTKEQPSGIRRWRRADEISEPEPGCWICIQNYPHLHLWLCSEFCLGGLIVNNFWTWAWLLDMYSELSPPIHLWLCSELVSEPVPGCMDMMVLRNVLMYSESEFTPGYSEPFTLVPWASISVKTCFGLRKKCLRLS